MLVLDTNHLTPIDSGSADGAKLRARLDASGEELAATIVSAEEQLRGWLAQINRAHHDAAALVFAYERLQRRLEFFAEWLVLPFDQEAVELFARLRSQGIRIATLDLRIACITIAHDATLFTRNTIDFARVPGLKFADWLA